MNIDSPSSFLSLYGIVFQPAFSFSDLSKITVHPELSLCHLQILFSVLSSGDWTKTEKASKKKKIVAGRPLEYLPKGLNFNFSLTSFQPFSTAESPSFIYKMGMFLALFTLQLCLHIV